MNKVEPIYLEYEDGRKYTLEFSRETVKYAENHGFRRDDIVDKMMVRIPELFYYAFRMHHPTLTQKDTDKILFDDLGGITDALSDRLADLYNAPYEYLINEGEQPKNSQLKVIM